MENSEKEIYLILMGWKRIGQCKYTWWHPLDSLEQKLYPPNNFYTGFLTTDEAFEKQINRKL
jgi:hypothetical protein